MCAFFGHLLGMQILFLWGLKKCQKDDSFCVEGVLEAVHMVSADVFMFAYF